MRNFVKLLLSIGFIAILFSGCGGSRIVNVNLSTPIKKVDIVDDKELLLLVSDFNPFHWQGCISSQARVENNILSLTGKCGTEDKPCYTGCHDLKNNRYIAYDDKKFKAELEKANATMLKEIEKYQKLKVEYFNDYKQYEDKIKNPPNIILEGISPVNNSIYNAIVNNLKENWKIKVNFLGSYASCKGSIECINNKHIVGTYLNLKMGNNWYKYTTFDGSIGFSMDNYKKNTNLVNSVTIPVSLSYAFVPDKFILSNNQLSVEIVNTKSSYNMYGSSNDEFMLVITNLTNKYVEVDTLSIYTVDKIHNEQLNLKLAPKGQYTKEIVNYNSAFLPIKTFTETQRFGASVEYGFQGSSNSTSNSVRETLFKEINIKVPNSL
ncbi:hypothetical protein NG754_04705 [Aliarcobacter cryaerophilus]|uniref:hypothetical protein n=1 Tax=Aliarcobacter cryaerophilus TaxID=28198 RepID=UPI003DA6A16B